MKIAEQKPWTGCVYWHSLRSCPLPNIPFKKEKKNRQITGELNKPGGEQKIYIIRLSDPQRSLRSCPFPIIPLCLSKKNKKKNAWSQVTLNVDKLTVEWLFRGKWIFWPFLNKRLVPRILRLAIGLLYVFLHEVEVDYNKPIITEIRWGHFNLIGQCEF